ncbi:hypothetical protein BHE74_00009611 [Ensete ventricosum]|nr:hypothetical protein BHE74_00009611 [Ensete ventricosum]
MLQCGIGCNKGAAVIGGRWGSDVHSYCGGGQQQYRARDDCCCVQFVAGRDQDSWQRTIVTGYDVNKLQRKITAGSFLPQGSLLAAIKEVSSKRSLLAALSSKKMHAMVEWIREIGRLKDWWTPVLGFWVQFLAVLGAIWGYDFVEFRL